MLTKNFIHNFVLLTIACRLLSIAEETLQEYLSKATGTAVDWVQMPGMKVRETNGTVFFIKIRLIKIKCLRGHTGFNQ